MTLKKNEFKENLVYTPITTNSNNLNKKQSTGSHGLINFI